MAVAPEPNEILRSTNGRDNFQRVSRLLISGGTALLREIFDNIYPPSSLPTILKNPATEKQLKAAKLTKPQWDCLYPSPGVYGKSTDFDVTLLFRLLRTICGLTPPTTGWDALPVSTDHSLEADLARIKYHRNSVYGHVNQNMEVSDEQFLSLWSEISRALVRIAGQISSSKKKKWQEAIDNFLKDPLTTEDERNVQELLDWYRKDTEVKKSVEELTNKTEDVQQKLDRLETTIKDIKVGLEGKTHVATTDIEDMKDMLCKLTGLRVQILSPTDQEEDLTTQIITGSSQQRGVSEMVGRRAVEDVTENGLGSDVVVNEITQKYERVQALQDELNKQIVRLRCLKEEGIDICEQLLTELQKWKSGMKSTMKICIAGLILTLASSVASFFTTELREWRSGIKSAMNICITGLTLTMASSVASFSTLVWSLATAGTSTVSTAVNTLRDPWSTPKKEKVDTTLIQLQFKVGQCIEVTYVLESKMALFVQCLDDFADFCREHTNDMLVVRHRGTLVSRQQVLIDIYTFMLRFSEEVLELKGNEVEATAFDIEAEITELSEEELLMLMKRKTTLFSQSNLTCVQGGKAK